MSTGILIFFSALLIFVLWGVAIYNRLISLKNRFTNAFSQIDVQLQRRYDLIPNLVEVASKYLDHEKSTLTQVIEARNSALTAKTHASDQPGQGAAMQGLIAAEAHLGRSMGQLFALAENYPDLKANQTMQSVMEELSTTENKVAFARQAYNDSVMTYNTYRAQLPNIFIANAAGHHEPASFFEVEEAEAKKPVRVKFS